MVKIGLLLLALVFSELLYSQTDSLEDDYLIMVVDQAPCYKIDDSERKLKEFILKNIDYSNIDTTKKIEGIVYISFWIDSVGNTFSHKVIRGIREDLDNEALRVSRLIKFEKPAMQRGKPIKIKYTVPVKFVLPRQVKLQKVGCKKYCQQDSIQEMGYPFEEAPIFDGNLRLFVEKNIVYPKAAISDSIEGKVFVKYMVDTLGFTKRHIVEKGIRTDIDAEAIRVAQMIKYERHCKL